MLSSTRKKVFLLFIFMNKRKCNVQNRKIVCIKLKIGCKNCR